MKLFFHDVKHVLDMSMNLISIGLLNDEGYVSSFGNGQWKLTWGYLIIARGKRCPKLYITQPKISYGIVNVLGNVDMIALWHKRLDHMTEKGICCRRKRFYLV